MAMSDYMDDREQRELDGYTWVWRGVQSYSPLSVIDPRDWFICQVCGARGQSRSTRSVTRDAAHKRHGTQPDDHWDKANDGHLCREHSLLCRLEKVDLRDDSPPKGT